MSRCLFFTTVCPICKHKTQLKIQYLGKMTSCDSCSKQFEANSPDSFSAALEDPMSYWVRFTESGTLESNEELGLDSKSDFGCRDIGRNPR